jgi:D-amino-acid dehydrogenase
MDDRYKIAITPLHREGTSSLRAAGMAMLGPPSAHAGIGVERQREAANTLWRVASQWFDGLAPMQAGPTTAQASPSPRFWMGARPMLPDGLPLIGRLRSSGTRGGLWLNSGHGSTGWAMAAGSAYLLADQMFGERPALVAKRSRRPNVCIPATQAFDVDARRFCPSRWLGTACTTR